MDKASNEPSAEPLAGAGTGDRAERAIIIGAGAIAAAPAGVVAVARARADSLTLFRGEIATIGGRPRVALESDASLSSLASLPLRLLRLTLPLRLPLPPPPPPMLPPLLKLRLAVRPLLRDR